MGWSSNAPVDVLVIIDGSLDFALTATFSTPQPVDRCENALALTSGALLSSQSTTGFLDDYAEPASYPFRSSYPDRAWNISVSPGNRLQVTATPTTADNTVYVSFDPLRGQSESVYVAVSPTGPSPATSFTLAVTYQAVTVGPTGDVCGNAEVISAGTLTQQSMATFADDYATSTPVPDRVYVVDVPAGKTLSATATSRDTQNLVQAITLVDQPAVTCGWPNIAAATGSDGTTVMHTNNQQVAKRVFIIVDCRRATTTRWPPARRPLWRS